MTSPGYAYERAPDQEHFLNRTRTKELFREIFRRGEESKKRGKVWKFNQSPLFLDFLAGNQPMPARHGATRRATCSAGSAPAICWVKAMPKPIKELMETTDWDKYGVGNYEKCADCMVHSGFEATAVLDLVKKPWKMATLAIKGIKTEGAMAKDIPLDKARKAEFVFSKHVDTKMAEIHAKKAAARSSPLSKQGKARGFAPAFLRDRFLFDPPTKAARAFVRPAPSRSALGFAQDGQRPRPGCGPNRCHHLVSAGSSRPGASCAGPDPRPRATRQRASAWPRRPRHGTGFKVMASAGCGGTGPIYHARWRRFYAPPRSACRSAAQELHERSIARIIARTFDYLGRNQQVAGRCRRGPPQGRS